jgi:hypothetical protein
MNADAAAGRQEIYEELSANHPGLLGALTARAEAQAVRLAMIYALWDSKSQIEMPHLLTAVAVVEFCRASVEYVFGDALRRRCRRYDLVGTQDGRQRPQQNGDHLIAQARRGDQPDRSRPC